MISWTCIHRQEEYRNVMCPFCIQNICSFVQPCCEIKNESCGECVHHGGCLEYNIRSLGCRVLKYR